MLGVVLEMSVFKDCSISLGIGRTALSYADFERKRFHPHLSNYLEWFKDGSVIKPHTFIWCRGTNQESHILYALIKDAATKVASFVDTNSELVTVFRNFSFPNIFEIEEYDIVTDIIKGDEGLRTNNNFLALLDLSTEIRELGNLFMKSLHSTLCKQSNNAYENYNVVVPGATIVTEVSDIDDVNYCLSLLKPIFNGAYTSRYAIVNKYPLSQLKNRLLAGLKKETLSLLDPRGAGKPDVSLWYYLGGKAVPIRFYKDPSLVYGRVKDLDVSKVFASALHKSYCDGYTLILS